MGVTRTVAALTIVTGQVREGRPCIRTTSGRVVDFRLRGQHCRIVARVRGTDDDDQQPQGNRDVTAVPTGDGIGSARETYVRELRVRRRTYPADTVVIVGFHRLNRELAVILIDEALSVHILADARGANGVHPVMRAAFHTARAS